MTAHGIDPHLWIGCVDQLQNSQSLLLNQVACLRCQFVIAQSPALYPDAFVPATKIAIETLLLADAGYVDRGNHKNSPAVHRRFDLCRAAYDCPVQVAALPEPFAP